MTRADKRTGMAPVAGAELYYEVRGEGPAVLLIPGATGDAGHFEGAAEVLAPEYTVVTYDRRGNSRSKAAGATSLDQHAEDAASLLRTLKLAPATVFGTSGGAIIALRLALRAPEVARHVIVHEPPFVGALPDAAELGSIFRQRVEHGLAARGPEGAMELFIRENAGDEVFDRLDPVLRQRMIGNGSRFFEHELPMFMSWIPQASELANLRVPVRVLGGRDNRGNYHYRAAEWLASALGVGIVEIPGAHAPYLAAADEFARALRPLIAEALMPS